MTEDLLTLTPKYPESLPTENDCMQELHMSTAKMDSQLLHSSSLLHKHEIAIGLSQYLSFNPHTCTTRFSFTFPTEDSEHDPTDFIGNNYTTDFGKQTQQWCSKFILSQRHDKSALDSTCAENVNISLPTGSAGSNIQSGTLESPAEEKPELKKVKEELVEESQPLNPSGPSAGDYPIPPDV